MTHRIIARIRNKQRRSFRQARPFIEDLKALEIGGPTPTFSRSGPFPAYKILRSVDNVNFSEDNFWSDVKDGKNFFYDPAKPPGRQFISDAIDLTKLDSGSYDVVLSSHAIEHLANPLKALGEWRRVLCSGGHMVLIAPDMRYTYDRRRPLTSIQHIIKDFELETLESDATHFEEIIALHDLSNDGTASTMAEVESRTRDNARQRTAHHHVFDLNLLQNLVTTAGFEVIVSDVFRPCHLLVVARKID